MGKLSPIRIFVIYWGFTLLLYAFGPFAWVTYEPILFWSLNIIFIFAFFIGWIISEKEGIKREIEWTDEDDKGLLKRLGPLLYINLFYEVVNLFRTFLFDNFNFSALIKRIIFGITNMGDSYNSFQNNVNATSADVVGGHFVTMFNYIWEIWSFPILFFGILYFKKLQLHQKCIAAACVFLEIISYLARGTNIGVFRIVLIFLVLYYIRYMKSEREPNKKNRGNRTKLVVLGLIAIVIVVQLFDKIMKSRGGIAYWQMDFYNIGGIHINRDSVFFKILPKGFHQLLVSLSGYLSQGYYGMSLTMRVPWEPMWGVGYSMALQNLLRNFIPSITDASYQNRIEHFGWDSYTQWHSMYSWFANDLTYFGVIIVMFLFGFFFYKALRDSLELNNPYAKVMLYYMFLMAVFLPCNNQIAQTTYTLFSFIYVFIKWQLSKRNVRIVL